MPAFNKEKESSIETPQTQTSNLRQKASILLAAAFYGLITVAGQYFADLNFSLYEIALLIVFMPLPLLPGIILIPGFRIPKRLFGFYAVFGVIGALLQITQFGGIVLGVPVAIVALLLYTQPIWTTVLGKVLLSEAITPKKIVAAVLAVCGLLVLINPFGMDVAFAPLGLLSAVLAGLCLSLWVIWGRKSGLHQQHFITTTFGYAAASGFFLLLFQPLLSGMFEDSAFLTVDWHKYAEHWPAVAAFVLFAGLTPAFLAFSGMRKVEASTAGILLLFEPVSAAVLAYLLFSQPLTANIWLGGGIILLANYVLLRRAPLPPEQ